MVCSIVLNCTALGLGSLPGYLLTVSMDFVSRSDLVSSLVLVCISVGKVTTPPLIGYLFQHVSYTWFVYVSFIFALIMFIVCLILIVMMFWASNLVSKVVTALLPKRLTVTLPFGCSSILILFSSILILFTTPLLSIALRIFVVRTGLGLESVTSYCLVLGLEVIFSTDIIPSPVLVCIYVGKVTTSPVIGYIFQNVSYTWFLYISLMFSLIDHILYTGLLYNHKIQ